MFASLTYLGQGWPDLLCDRLAVDPTGYLRFVSVVGDAALIKGLKGALNSHNMRAEFAIADFPEGAEVPTKLIATPTFQRTTELGYHDDITRLAYNQCHGMFWSKEPAFMLAAGDDHLWRELKSKKYTTPLLRDWLPWVRDQLIARNLLTYMTNYRCQCGAIRVTSDDLDRVVSDGLKSGNLTIPTRKDVA
jgi:hypothetical protein